MAWRELRKRVEVLECCRSGFSGPMIWVHREVGETVDEAIARHEGANGPACRASLLLSGNLQRG